MFTVIETDADGAVRATAKVAALTAIRSSLEGRGRVGAPGCVRIAFAPRSHRVPVALASRPRRARIASASASGQSGPFREGSGAVGFQRQLVENPQISGIPGLSMSANSGLPRRGRGPDEAQAVSTPRPPAEPGGTRTAHALALVLAGFESAPRGVSATDVLAPAAVVHRPQVGRGRSRPTASGARPGAAVSAPRAATTARAAPAPPAA